jgi:hypothetical protein
VREALTPAVLKDAENISFSFFCKMCQSFLIGYLLPAHFSWYPLAFFPNQCFFFEGWVVSEHEEVSKDAVN